MTPLAILEARLDRLRDIRAAGEKTVTSGDETVVFANDADLAAAVADLERQIAAASGVRPIKMVRFATTKGV